MAACDAGKMSLYIPSVLCLWDLNIPQEAATITYEDNDACTAMANAQNPSPRTRHMDIKYIALCKWVEQDLFILDRIDTKNNLADPFTKALERAAFHCHVDFILGHAPLGTHPPIPNRMLHILMTTQTLPTMYLNLLRLCYVWLPLEYMHRYRRILGFISYGMGSTIQSYALDCGGMISYR
jgi:hypothetical protein